MEQKKTPDHLALRLAGSFLLHAADAIHEGPLLQRRNILYKHAKDIKKKPQTTSNRTQTAKQTHNTIHPQHSERKQSKALLVDSPQRPTPSANKRLFSSSLPFLFHLSFRLICVVSSCSRSACHPSASPVPRQGALNWGRRRR